MTTAERAITNYIAKKHARSVKQLLNLNEDDRCEGRNLDITEAIVADVDRNVPEAEGFSLIEIEELLEEVAQGFWEAR